MSVMSVKWFVLCAAIRSSLWALGSHR